MGLTDWLVGATAKGAGELMGGAGELAKDLRAAITGDIDPEKKAELEGKALELEASIMRAQAEINKAEAQSSSLFVAGWRPAVGWICGIALALHYVIIPLMSWVATLYGIQFAPPVFDMATLETTLWGMLGLGTLRTLEKYTGVNKRH